MDVNPEFVRAINEARAPVPEPHLSEMLEQCGDRLTAASGYAPLIQDTDTTFLIVPTPSEPDGHFSDEYLREALTALAQELRRSRKHHHSFVVTSTVSPGTTEDVLIPLIEEVSGRRLGRGFSVCYNPEFIALGSVLRDFLNPDLVLIGESDPDAGRRLEELYQMVCENTPHVARMSLPSAEIVKISLNAYVTMKISFANTLTQLCEAIPGAQIDAVTEALGADRRISPHGLRGGLPYGGPCFPRDNRAFAAFAARHGMDARLAQATDDVNLAQVARLVDLVDKYLPNGTDEEVAILGLAYKPDTPVIEESPAVAVVEALIERGTPVRVYDPLALDAARARFGARVRYASSARECMARAGLTLVTMPLAEFAAIDDSFIVRNPATIVDCWRIVDPAKFQKSVRYVGLGNYRG